MHIRPYRDSDLDDLMRLYFETVRSVGLRAYTCAQVAAWAPDNPDRDAWSRRLAGNLALVAEESGQAVGFAELGGVGYVDMLFVHKDRQGQGIASALLAELESHARRQGADRLTTAASRIARPFFERRGFRLLEAETVQRHGEHLERFRMQKPLSRPQ